MPRYHTLEQYYANSYLLENDASVQQQVNPVSQGQEQGIEQPSTDAGPDDYNLRRAVLKAQEWIMYIDEKFADTVDEMGGINAFFQMMIDKMVEDEMIRPVQNAPEEEPQTEEEGQEENIEDSDIEFETQSKDSQQGPQSFQTPQKEQTEYTNSMTVMESIYSEMMK